MMKRRALIISAFFLMSGMQLAYAQDRPSGAPVEVASVVREAVEKKVTLTGTVNPQTRSVVASEVEGLVKQMLVDEGDFVKEGEQIAELGASIYQLQLEEAEAARKETEQRYLQARADLKRSEELVAKGFVAEKQLTDDRFNSEALQKKLHQHEAEIARLKDLLGKTRIFAPFSGTIAKKHTEVGQWVDKGGAVVTLIDLSRVRVRVFVPERHIPRVKVGQEASVTADALAGQSFPAVIDAIIAEGDPKARVFPVKFEVENREYRLKSGMLARVTFATGFSRKVLTVPKDALVSRGEASVVFTVESGTAKEVRVQVNDYHGDRAEIKGSIRAGDPVVIRGNERLRDGQPVLVLPDKGQT